MTLGELLRRTNQTPTASPQPQFSPTQPISTATQTSTPQMVSGQPLADFGSALGSVAKTVGQLTMQGFGGTGAAIKGSFEGLPEQARAAITNTPVAPGTGSYKSTFTPTGPTQEAIYGTKEPLGLGSYGEQFGASKAGFSPELIGGFGALLDVTGAGAAKNIPKAIKAAKATEGTFGGFTDLSTKLLEKLKGRTTVSKQFIEDLSNSPDLKQAERDLIRRVLGESDETGTLYHGTHKDFKGFDPNFDYEGLRSRTDIGQIRDYEVPEGYVFLTDSKSRAGIYGQKVVPTELKGKKVLKVNAGDESPDRFFDNDFNGDGKIWNKFQNGNYDALEITGKDANGNVSKTILASPDRLNVKSDQISVPDFANKVKSELLPLKTTEPRNISEYRGAGGRYENITLPEELRGPVANYQERVYESPIKTSAGDVHFSAARGGTPQNYFAHTRIEDLPGPGNKGRMIPPRNMSSEGQTAFNKRATELASTGDTRRVIELQSDLFQKGRLEQEYKSGGSLGMNPKEYMDMQLRENAFVDEAQKQKFIKDWTEKTKVYDKDMAEIAKLEPYRNTWHERVIREEVKQAAKDGKTKLQFPTGETAMKIEGLGQVDNVFGVGGRYDGAVKLSESNMKVGQEVTDRSNSQWIITDVLGDGKFKAVPKSRLDNNGVLTRGDDKTYSDYLDFDRFEKRLVSKNGEGARSWIDEQIKNRKKFLNDNAEQFDISGKVDTENPIYKFYEKEVGKYLKNKYGAQLVTDAQGVKWWEVDLKGKGFEKAPVEAFGVGAGVQPEYDEDGNVVGVKFDPQAALMGAAAVGLGMRAKGLSDDINLQKLALSEEGAEKVVETAKTLKPVLEAVKGKPLTNAEVLQAAQESDILRNATSREATLKSEAALLKTRQNLAALSEESGVSKEFIDSLRVVSAEATMRGRELQALGITADPIRNTSKALLVKKLIDMGADTDAIVKAAEGVDFNNLAQTTKFYRQFVKPTLTEILDEYRYINMLSSPRTHIVNAFSNLIQATLLNPATRLATGAIDSVISGLRASERNTYMSEVPTYYKGLFNAIPDASDAFMRAMSGKTIIERPDLARIPTGSKLLAPFQVVPRLLEGGDVFFRTLMEAGERNAIAMRYTKQGKEITPKLLVEIEKEAKEKAEYFVFRKALDPSNEGGQGRLLSEIDKATSAIYSLRKVPGISWFIPFVQTPMNILKQGIEYSPLGLGTLPGAANKTEQLGKMMVGSTIMLGAASFAIQGKTTWAAPSNAKEKEAFYESGRQPYSVKIGDRWISYSKLGPVSYPVAMAAAFKWYMDENPKAATQGNYEKMVRAISGIAQFFSDQSYMQGLQALIGDSNPNQVLSRTQNIFGNVAGQYIPLSSLLRWTDRIIDPVFRKPDTEFNLGNLLQSIEKDLPILSENVPPILGSGPRPAPLINAFSPVGVSPVNEFGERSLQRLYRKERTDAIIDARKERRAKILK